MDKNIREPQQDRAVKKKEAIIKAAYDVFSEVGYYNTNTADIAKKANVSTGIVYSYFKDKKDILFYVIKIYIEDVTKPLDEFINSFSPSLDVNKLADDTINLVVSLHTRNANLHNILHSLADTQEDINEEFMALEDRITKTGAAKLKEIGFNGPSITEKVHIIMNLVQSYAHESLYDKHDYIDYEAMRQTVKNCIVALLTC